MTTSLTLDEQIKQIAQANQGIAQSFQKFAEDCAPIVRQTVQATRDGMIAFGAAWQSAHKSQAPEKEHTRR